MLDVQPVGQAQREGAAEVDQPRPEGELAQPPRLHQGIDGKARDRSRPTAGHDQQGGRYHVNRALRTRPVPSATPAKPAATLPAP
jgi:hypothetical protein